MSFLKSSFNLSSFSFCFEEKVPSNSEIHDLLLKKKFKDLEPTQETGCGWTALDNIFKTDFSLEDMSFGSLIGIGLRIDTKKVPKAILKRNYSEKLKELKKEGIKLNKIDKNNLKEELKAQLLMKTIPNPAMLHVIIDFGKGKIYVDTKNLKVLDLVSKLFLDTFGILISINNYGLIEDKQNKFLNWIWGNKEKLQENYDLHIYQNMSLTASENEINFSGPSLDGYFDQFSKIIDEEVINKLGVYTTESDKSYFMLLNNKNPYISIKIEPKIKHENSETAVIINTDVIEKTITLLTKITKEYIK